MHKKGKAELAGYEPRYFQLRRDRLRTLEWYDADVSPGELPPEPKGRICLKSEGLKDVRETAVEPAAKLQRSECSLLRLTANAGNVIERRRDARDLRPIALLIRRLRRRRLLHRERPLVTRGYVYLRGLCLF